MTPSYIGHSYYSEEVRGCGVSAAEGSQRLSAVGQRRARYYKLGLTYEAMKQFEPARRAFETVIKNHNGTAEAQLARQALVRVQDKKEDPEP